MALFTLGAFAPEPPFVHGQVPRTAVLYCNLGTPDSASTADVRKFLREFLSDPRVVEIPRVLWMLILHGIILRFRPAKSAAKYASIWTAEGSPLKVWTEKQAKLLQGWLSQRGHAVQVRYAMRYGSQSIASQLDALKAEGVTRVLVVTAYPQYSATTTASVFDAVYQWAAKVRNLPELRFVNRYHDHGHYIQALAVQIQRYWKANGRPDQLVMSFHGVPERTLTLGDPYHCECLKTARLLAQALGLGKDQFKVTFQSRLGRAKWLEPYTEPSLIALGKAGVKRVDVVCPGFTSDCLETLEEINMEGREAFLHAGGQEFHYIPCLNDDTAWITALCEISQEHMAGWPTLTRPDAAALAAQRQAAIALGATQ
ncbi:ferrochelatase [Rhodoferax aquaticus]|uniref:Ferrochelatase n=1 Tax=Rhodoferax aquaticus TaxID=2527691 RepID=A0A515EMX6_9BURK|nr:ferrochelatase [Rhodoferax aquaticus]QDL54016.1 ferrochelatase [Rhodoferax aquaticus]